MSGARQMVVGSGDQNRASISQDRPRCEHWSGRAGPVTTLSSTTGRGHDHHVRSTADGYGCRT